MKPPEVIETNRLRLRLPQMSDAEEIFRKYAQDPDVTKYLMWAPHENVGITKEFIQRCIDCWKEGTAFPWAIDLKEMDELIGMAELRINDHRAETGYVIARQYWGNGYVAEAIKPIIEWSLSQSSIYRVWAVCDVENVGSARVMEKAGMQREGILRRYIIHPNTSDEPRDCFSYSIVK